MRTKIAPAMKPLTNHHRHASRHPLSLSITRCLAMELHEGSDQVYRHIPPLQSNVSELAVYVVALLGVDSSEVRWFNRLGVLAVDPLNEDAHHYLCRQVTNFGQEASLPYCGGGGSRTRVLLIGVHAPFSPGIASLVSLERAVCHWQLNSPALFNESLCPIMLNRLIY